jgi:CheY-like chemotaxis protein
MRRVLVVEDDYLQADWLEETLKKSFTDLNVQQIRTESEFRNKLGNLRRDPPDLILLDVMLRWTDPSPKIDVPTEEAKNGFFRAGLRCERLLRQHKETRRIPVILYTVLQETDLGKELIKTPPTYYVGKATDSSYLIDTINKAIRHHA